MTIKHLRESQSYVWQEIPYYAETINKIKSYYINYRAMDIVDRFIFTYIWSERILGGISKHEY